MNIDLAANIAGWMTYEELKWLAKQAKKHQRIVEIGSYQGRSTRALGDNTPGVVVAVDDFKGPRDKDLPVIMRENVLESFLWSVYDLIDSGKVIVSASDHSEVKVGFSPDMVFIDGSHLYPDVMRDIETWKQRVVPGGLICGHDYTNIPDVQQAVKDSFMKFKVSKNTSIWYVTV